MGVVFRSIARNISSHTMFALQFTHKITNHLTGRKNTRKDKVARGAIYPATPWTKCRVIYLV